VNRAVFDLLGGYCGSGSVVLDGSPAPPALGTILRINGVLNADRVALSFGGGDTTYAELLRASVRVANALRAEGLGRGDRIAILAKNGLNFFEILFGAAMLGVVVVPVNWRLTAPEIGFLVRDSGAHVLFAGREFAGLADAVASAAESAIRMIELDGERARGYARWRDTSDDKDCHDPITADMVALHLYTSGTTGKPKGALLTHHSLNSVRVSQPQAAWNHWSPADSCLVSMPPFHIGGIGTALASIYHGARTVIAREFEPDALLDCIERDRITRLFFAPTAMHIILDHPRSRSTDFSGLRYIFYGSSPISAALLREAMAVFRCGFVQFYGMTETSGAVAALPPEDHHPECGQRMRSAGKALHGVEIAILDEAGNRLPSGKVGEVSIRSQANMLGYWGRPEATAACLQPDGFLRSGDTGYLDGDGYLFICDRLQNMVITGGENVYAAEVEAVLCEYPSVVEAAVIGVPDARWGEAVTAVIVGATGAAVNVEDLRTWARSKLAGYKVPKSFHCVKSLPKNSAGKVLHRQLREYYSSND
jgi:long-chain acyl-CoA synthetase